MKKLILLLIIPFIFNISLSAEEVEKEENDVLNINGKSAIIMEASTKKVLFEKNADKKVPMASTTKIMTILVVLENAKLTDTVTISQKAAQTGRIATRIENKRQNHGRRLTIWLNA